MNTNDEYHLALGRFVDAFATAEHNLKFALRTTAGTTDEVAQVLFSSTRVDAAINQIKQIKQIYEAKNEVLTEEVDSALIQMKTISTVRNTVLHYGAQVAGDHFTTSKGPHALPAKADTRRHPIGDLDKMTADLMTVAHRFGWICSRALPNAYPEAIERLNERASAPLQYKSPPASQNRAKKSSVRIPRKHPSQESPE